MCFSSITLRPISRCRGRFVQKSEQKKHRRKESVTTALCACLQCVQGRNEP